MVYQTTDNQGVIHIHFSFLPVLTQLMVMFPKYLHTQHYHTGQNNIIHQLNTMLATSKNVPFPGSNHVLTTGADDPSL